MTTKSAEQDDVESLKRMFELAVESGEYKSAVQVSNRISEIGGDNAV